MLIGVSGGVAWGQATDGVVAAGGERVNGAGRADGALAVAAARADGDSATGLCTYGDAMLRMSTAGECGAPGAAGAAVAGSDSWRFVRNGCIES